ncbi:NADPH-dependent F420 reductase [Okeanomitos corallinicola TIOX110]|uniref:NADPH-dependent F420 reductase n=1 Tax=Okeanomitos corallinicola TIOX110 TaxID=3133117 RepID=A0ABZ2UWS9_9CYAN
MKIGILGAGNIGGNLGKLWAETGHEVFFAVRSPQSDKVQAILNSITANFHTGTIEEAVTFADVILLSIHWQNVPEILTQIQDIITDKILIDSTNRMIPPPADTTGSAAGDIARLLPTAKIIKAFNTLGANNLTNLQFGAENASTFICGDDTEAKSIVTQLAQEIGFDVVDVGLLNTAPLIESLAKLWVQISRQYGRETAFKLLKR